MKAQHDSESNKELVDKFQVTLRLDMMQAEQIIRALAKAYGWDQFDDLINQIREEEQG